MSWPSFCQRHQSGEARPATLCRTPARNWWRSLALSGVIHHFKPFPAHTTTTVENQPNALVLPKVAQDPLKIALAAPVGEARPAHGVDLQLLVAELPQSLGDCWGPGPFAVQVAGEAAARHDEVCAWRSVAYVLMFWLGLLTWVVLPSKTRCSPSTKRYTFSRLKPLLRPVSHASLTQESRMQSPSPGRCCARQGAMTWYLSANSWIWIEFNDCDLERTCL